MPNLVLEPDWRIDIKRLQGLISLFKQRNLEYPDTVQTDIIVKDFIHPLFESIGWQNGETSAYITSRGDRQGLPYFSLELGREIKAIVFAFGTHNQTNSEFVANVAVGTAYNLEVDWAVVSNFAETTLYHTLHIAREAGDSSPAGPPVAKYSFQDYAKADEPMSLVNTVSPLAFARGYTDELGKNIAQQQQRRWRQALTELMLQLLKEWQFELLESISGDEQELNLAINRLFHRLIFIRSVEDRGLDQQHSLQEVVKAKPEQALEVLHNLFTHFRNNFDSELFTPSLVDQMQLNGSTLQGRIKRLYEPAVVPIRFDFSLIDPDMMGRLYEQHLRLRISIPTRSQEEHLPEFGRRIVTSSALRTQGIYYTPTWLVNYIVEHTLGKWLDKRRPATWDDVKVLDLACGSGAFLQRAYEELLTYFKNQWEQQGKVFGYCERREILEKSIFGVDENRGAVQNTQLVLWLRAQPTSDHVEAHELPQLDNNIVCGNSLLGGLGDPTKEKELLLQYYDSNWQNKKPIIWKERFSKIINNGGFDIIVGNPPFANIRSLHRERPDDIPYLCAAFDSAKGNFDQAALFVEQAFRLLHNDGLLGMVIPDGLLHSAAGKALRDILTEKQAVYRMVDFTGEEIFKRVMVYPRLLFLQHRPSPKLRSITIRHLERVSNIQLAEADKTSEVLTAEVTAVDAPHPVDSAAFSWFFRTNRENVLRKKLEDQSNSLQEIANVRQGPNTGADDVFVLEQVEKSEQLITVFSKSLNRRYEIEASLIRPFLDRKDVQPYSPLQTSRVCLCPYFPSGELIPSDVLALNYPRAWEYLNTCRETLLKHRQSVRFSELWYGFSRPTLVRYLYVPAVVVPFTARNATYCLISDQRYQIPGRAGCGNVIEFNKPDDALIYLGLLNSSLLNWYLQGMSSLRRGGYYEYTKGIVENLPIIRSEICADSKEWIQQLENLTSRAIDHMQQSKSHRFDLLYDIQKKIDKIVYWLYNLTAEEILLVEANHYKYKTHQVTPYLRYPKIVSDKTILNGEPIIEGTRTTVRTIILYSRIVPSREELVAAFHHLNPEQVNAALLYYSEHKYEIDHYISNNEELALQDGLFG